jgi:kynurenine formamidase
MTQASAEEVAAKAWPGHQGNWGRWPNDRGTLNLITPEVVQRAAKEVKLGVTVACSCPLKGNEVTSRFTGPAVEHEMLKADDGGFDEGDLTQSAADRLGYRIHGMTNTHIDALSHMGYRGKTFNGYDFPDVATMAEGAKKMDVTDLLAIVTRGVLIDVAAARGVDYLRPGDSVAPEDIEGRLAGLMPGDAVVIRTGGSLVSGRAADGASEHGGWHHGTWAGLDTDVVEMLASKDVSMICTDSPGDTFPHRHEKYVRSPIHVLCEVFYGIPLIHNMDLEQLATTCSSNGRDSFLMSVSSINQPNATGSLTTPIAVL